MLLICPLIYKYTLLHRLTCRDTSVNLKHTIALGLLLAPTFAIAENTPDLNEIWRIVQQQQQTIKALTEKLDRALRVLDRTQTQLAGAQEQLTEQSERIEATAEVVDESRGVSKAASWAERTQIGGYGELH